MSDDPRRATRAAGDPRLDRRADRASLWILAGALVLGLARFWRLSEWSLWIDEALTWTDYHVGFQGGEIKNPLGYLLIAAGVRALGGVPDELALRILPAVAGWLCIPGTYFALRRWLGPRRAAAAALLVALSSWHVYWSQNARFYTFAQLAALAGGGIALSGLLFHNALRAVLGLVLAAVAALFHPSAALVPLAWLVAASATRRFARSRTTEARRVERVVVLCALVGLVLASPWIWTTFETYRVQKAHQASLAGGLASIAHFAKTTGFYVTPLVCAAAVVGAWIGVRRREREVVFLALAVAFALALASCAAIFVRVSAQYVFVLFPWIAALAVAPLEERADVGEEGAAPRETSARAPAWLTPAWLALLVLPAAVNVFLYFTVRKGERPEWREAYDLVASLRGEEDLVLGMETPVGEYYLNPRSTDLRHTRRVAWLDYFNARAPRAWAEHARRAWYVVNPELLYDWDPADAAVFRRMLANECRLVRCFPLYVESRDLSVWVYVRG